MTRNRPSWTIMTNISYKPVIPQTIFLSSRLFVFETNLLVRHGGAIKAKHALTYSWNVWILPYFRSNHLIFQDWLWSRFERNKDKLAMKARRRCLVGWSDVSKANWHQKSNLFGMLLIDQFTCKHHLYHTRLQSPFEQNHRFYEVA